MEQRALASVLDGAIGAGATFLAFGDQSVTVPFIGAQFGSFVQPDAQVVPAASFSDNGWVVGAVLLMVVMQSYLGVTPGKLVVGIAVVRDVDARPIGLAGTALRWLAHILDSIFLIGYLRPLWNAQRKTFADSIMATVVVDTRRPRRRRLAAFSAAIAAAVVVGVLVTTQSTHLAVQQPIGRGATTPAPSATPTPTVSKPASQSAGDARVYGIDPAIAALPIGVRVWPPPPDIWPVATTQSSTPEGLWLVSHPGAFEGADLAAHPQLTDYGELLLMTPDRSRILSVYPFPAVPPQWLLVTPLAVYCGRQGDGGLPDSMVCRVDRSTSALTVVVFPSPTDSAFGEPQALAGRPGSWRLASSLTPAFLQPVPRLTANGLLFAPDPNVPGGGKSLLLDPVSLRSWA